MCQIQVKKLFAISLLLSLFSVGVFSQEDAVMQKSTKDNYQKTLTTQESNSNSSEINMKNNEDSLMILENNSVESEKVSTNPLDFLDKQMNLLENLDNQFKTLETQLETAETQLNVSKNLIEQLKKQLQNCKEQIVNLEKSLKEYDAALQSNKEDTDGLLGQLGEMYTKAVELETRLEKLEKRLFNSYIFTTVGISVSSLVPVTLGFIEYCNGNEVRGKDYMWTGLGMFVGFQLVYQGGHWIFQWW